MSKIWQVMSKIEDDFIKKYPEYSPVVLQLLKNRDLKTKEEMKEFLEADFEKYTYDPFLFSQMEKVIDLIIKHIKAQNKIIVYGDYDVDGVTSSAVLVEILSLFKAQVESYIPDRVDEGYGLNKNAVEEISRRGAKLIITVDCGIRSKEEIGFAKELGMEVILTDHHSGPEKVGEYPNCLIVCPSLIEENYPFRYLAGVGVAYKVAKALIQRSKLEEKQKKLLEERILDLVAVGTVSDCVSLLGENRVLVKKGLEELNNGRRIGLKKLLEIAQVNSKVLDAWNIGFQIGPRINAAGRMEHANYAYDLLVTKSEKEASKLSRKLNSLNQDRQKITEEIMEEVESQIENDGKDNLIIGICESKENAWNEGVVGLVAGRICEKYYRPILVITKTEEGYKGSGRSIEEFNIIEAIEDCSEYLDKYGGHPAACGFSFSEENKLKFLEKIKDLANKKLENLDLKPKIYIEAEIDVKDITEDLLDEIQRFAPFGQDNNKPKFLSHNIQIRDVMTMGTEGQHIKFRLNGIWALSFNGAEEWKDFQIGDFVDMVYYIDKNEFNGRSEIQLKIVDMKPRNT